MSSASVNMTAVTQQTAGELGRQIGMLTLEVNAQMAARNALERRVQELQAEVDRLTAPADRGGAAAGSA